LFHANRQADTETDKQTDMPKLVVAFHNFSNAPNKLRFIIIP